MDLGLGNRAAVRMSQKEKGAVGEPAPPLFLRVNGR
jgi:hypothetical protein